MQAAPVQNGQIGRHNNPMGITINNREETIEFHSSLAGWQWLGLGLARNLESGNIVIEIERQGHGLKFDFGFVSSSRQVRSMT